MSALFDAETTVRPGQVLGGRYRVERVLGMGGMGVVVAARHIELNTSFAIKLMRRDAAKDEESVERFLREARAAVKLKSQHCVRVIDVGKLDDGAPYMVMELLAGRDLAELVAASGARPPAEAVDYILQACEGVAEAHSHRIVHRDIKPQNLFVTRGIDGMPLVKVLDFGLAKSLKTTPEVRALTHTTAVMGSPLYMSPEQMRASRRVDARADQWSLAVCLYELITGRAPFEGATYPELCSSVLNEPPAPMPSDIPRGLTRVIVRCLQKDPRRRYADLVELATALEEFASVPGAAGRVRAVLHAPPRELESLQAELLNDSDAETTTAASVDTTKQPGRRDVWPRGGARWPTLVAVALLSGVITYALRKPAALHPAASPGPVSAAIAAPPPGAPPASSAPAAIAPVAADGVTPVASAADLSAARPVHAHGALGHRAPTQPTAAVATARPKSSGPVLVPKTTEF